MVRDHDDGGRQLHMQTIIVKKKSNEVKYPKQNYET